MAQQPLVGQDLLIVEVPRSHYNTLGRTPLGKWSAQQTDLYLTTLKRDTQSPCGIRTHNPNKRAAADPLLGPRSYWDRL